MNGLIKKMRTLIGIPISLWFFVGMIDNLGSGRPDDSHIWYGTIKDIDSDYILTFEPTTPEKKVEKTAERYLDLSVVTIYIIDLLDEDYEEGIHIHCTGCGEDLLYGEMKLIEHKAGE